MTDVSSADLLAIDEEWCRVLGVAEPDDGADFFELGGDSLRAVEFMRAVKDRTGVDIDLEILFIEGTLGSLKTEAAKSRDQA